MAEAICIPRDKDTITINPFNSKMTIADSYIFSGYLPPTYNTRTLQTKIFNYLDRPSGWKCLIYHLSIFSIVITTLTISALETVHILPWTRICLYVLEIILVIVLGLEYVTRIWAAGSQSCYRHIKGRLKYICHLANLFDLIIFLGSVLSLTVGASEGMFTASTMKVFRLVQIIRIARIDRRGATWGLLNSVIYGHRKELITSLYIGFLGLLLSSYLMFIVENYYKPSSQFRSLADAFYWGIVTVTTIGYGDVVPETWLGKTICACGSIITISFFALPAGILGSGFALKVQQEQRQKHYNKQIPAAATLIQMMWRYNRTNKFVGSNATWTKYALAAGEYRKKHLKRRRAMLAQTDNKIVKPIKNHLKINTIPDSFSDYENYELTSIQRKQIRVISTIQFFVARGKFQQLRNPYDVQDIIEQYSQGHFHMMIKIKDLHRKLDNTIGNVNEYKFKNRSSTVLDSLDELNRKIDQLEYMVRNIENIVVSLASPTCRSPAKPQCQVSLGSSDANDDNDEMDTSSPDRIPFSSKNSNSAHPYNSRKKHLRSLHSNRFYLGHQSVLSD